jgi:hypothetical protein
MLILLEIKVFLQKKGQQMLNGESRVAAQHGDYATALRKQAAMYMEGLLSQPKLLALQEPRHITAVSGLIPNLEHAWCQAVETEFASCAELIYTELQHSLSDLDSLIRLQPFGIELRTNTAPMLTVCPWCNEEHAILYRIAPEDFQPILFRKIIVRLGLAPCTHPLPISESLWRIIQNQQHILDTPVT